ITLSQGTSFQRLNNGLSTDSINVLDEFYVQPSAGSINSSIGLSPASTAVVGVMAFKPLPIAAPSTSSQNVVAAIPVNAIDPPPEGQRAAKINVSLTPISFYNANQFQLNSQSGLTLSQVCTLVIDNSQNSSPITVVHGALSQQVLVPQNTTTIVPTFSTKGYYFLSVAAITAPSQTLNIPITLLNYVRQGGQFSAQQNVNVQNAGAIDITVGGPTPITIQNTILNTGHNSTVLVSSIAQLTPGAPTITFGTAALKAWLLDSLDFSIESMQGTAAGVCFGTVQVVVGGQVIHVCFPVYTFAAAGYIQGSINNQASRTWSQGLLITGSSAIQVKLTGPNNLTSISVRLNLSGYKQ